MFLDLTAVNRLI